MKTQTLTAVLLGTALVGGGTAAAIAQRANNTYDAAQMPALHGTVARYDLTPRGDVDGLILQDGTEVHFPPHLGTELVALVRPGDTITVHGLKARVLPLVQAMSVTADASGKTVADIGLGRPPHGPGRPPPPAPGAEMQAQGVVKLTLHGPRGDVNGAMLEDGTLIHLPPPEAERLAAQLQPGQTVAVRGDGVDNSLGRSIGVRALGPAPDRLTELAAPPPRGPRGPGHGPGHGDDAAVPLPPGR